MKMLLLLIAVLLAGCTVTRADHSPPMPVCNSPDECATKMSAAETWLREHNYTVSEKSDGLAAISPAVVMSIHRNEQGTSTTLEVQAQCLPTLSLMLGLSGCSDSYDAVYGVVGAINSK